MHLKRTVAAAEDDPNVELPQEITRELQEMSKVRAAALVNLCEWQRPKISFCVTFFHPFLLLYCVPYLSSIRCPHLSFGFCGHGCYHFLSKFSVRPVDRQLRRKGV
jgi:hypothetical protein